MTIIIVGEFLSKVFTRMDLFLEHVMLDATSTNFEQVMGQKEKSKW